MGNVREWIVVCSPVSRLLLVSFFVGWGGCCSTEISPPRIDYPNVERLRLHVLMDLSKECRELRGSVSKPYGPVISLGGALVVCTKDLCSTLFTEVTDPQSLRPDSVGKYDAVLSIQPGLLTEPGSPFFALSQVTTSIDLEWQLSTPGGRVVWSERIKGSGSGTIGNSMTGICNLQSRLHVALREMYLKAFRGIIASTAVQELQ